MICNPFHHDVTNIFGTHEFSLILSRIFNFSLCASQDWCATSIFRSSIHWMASHKNIDMKLTVVPLYLCRKWRKMGFIRFLRWEPPTYFNNMWKFMILYKSSPIHYTCPYEENIYNKQFTITIEDYVKNGDDDAKQTLFCDNILWKHKQMLKKKTFIPSKW